MEQNKHGRKIKVGEYKGYLIYSNGKIQSLKTLKFLKPMKSGANYQVVKIKGRREYIHRIVATVFLSSKLGTEVNHKDGNKHNNCISNLEWATRQENMRHAKEHGKMKRGSQIVQSKLNEKQVKAIKSRLALGVSNQRQIAKEFGVHYVTINDIKTGRSWGHIV